MLRQIPLLFILLGVAKGPWAQDARNEAYFETNWGLAYISGFSSDGVFPGTSLLAGGRTFIGKTSFVEGQFGLAFPSIVTAKVGGGWKWDSGWSYSTGVRIWPLHVYASTGVPTKRCNRNISASKQRKLERRGKTAADLKCSEWVFSFELSMLGLGTKVFPEWRERVDHSQRTSWAVSALDSYGMITVGHRWLF